LGLVPVASAIAAAVSCDARLAHHEVRSRGRLLERRARLRRDGWPRTSALPQSDCPRKSGCNGAESAQEQSTVDARASSSTFPRLKVADRHYIVEKGCVVWT